MSSASLSIMFRIETAGVYTGTLEAQRTKNDLDAHGMFLDLRRLPGESGVSYFKRLMSVVPLRAGSNQEGLVHGATRELGLEEKVGIIISPTLLGGVTVAPSPFVEVTATELILYSRYSSSDSSTNVVDRRIDIFGHGDGYLLHDVLLQIQQSAFFTATLGDYTTGYEKSCGLMPTSSNKVIEKEWVPPGTYFRLKNRGIVPGTLTFTEVDVFRSELSPAVAGCSTGPSFSIAFSITTPVVSEGQYYIDYPRGVVTTYTTGSGFGSCRYAFSNFPLRIKWSPVSVYSLRDPIYREKVFEMEEMPDNVERETIVSPEGKEVYDQVFSKSPSLWGV